MTRFTDAHADEVFKEDGFQWSDTKRVPATSIVSGSVMLLADDGHCVGLVTVLQCESEAVRCDVERALASAGNPAKMRRFMNAARSGEAEANERAEKAEAERDAAIAERDRLRKALEIACRRGCNHCADDIKAARRIDNEART